MRFDAEQNLNLNIIVLHADPGRLCGLPRIDLFSLANNHISDAYSEGVDDTMQALNQHKKTYFGYCRGLQEARRPSLIEKDGIRLGFLGYSCLSTNGENYATSVTPGVCPIAVDYPKTDILRLQNEVDYIVVVLHWGEEHMHHLTPDQIAPAHKAVDQDASAIIGTHPHVIQGIERYKDRFIRYSLGNFIFSDIEYELLLEGPRVRGVSRLSNANKESIGVEFVFDLGQLLNSGWRSRLFQNLTA